MGVFICQKCGNLDNTACGNNFYTARRNKYYLKKYGEFESSFKPEYEYFETHECCSDCCGEIEYDDSPVKFKDSIRSSLNIKDKHHWTEYGKEKLLELEAMKDGSCENATEFFESHGI